MRRGRSVVRSALLQELLQAEVGLDPDWVEAVAFAWLAMRTVNGRTGNLPSVTGAGRKVILGTIHSP